MKLKYLLASAIIVLPTTAAFAEDIEIYSATVGSGDAGNVFPNVLFIMDTSGSMRGHVPVAFGGYNSGIDYDDTNNDDLIHVYDLNLTYQNISYTRDQVACQSLLDFHDSNPSLPLYAGQTLQWASQSETVAETVCEPEDLSVFVPFNPDGGPLDISSRNPDVVYQEFITLDNFLDETFIEVRVENTGNNAADVELGYYYVDQDNRTRVVNVCDVDVNGGSTGGCIDTSALAVDSIPETRRRGGQDHPVLGIRVRIEVDRNNRDTSILGNIVYNIGATGEPDPTCVPSPSTTTLFEDWTNDLFNPTNANEVLECQDDAGEHGLSDTSLERYASFCPDDSCTEPNYTSTPPGVDWTSNSITPFYFVDQNFHDYLNSELGAGIGPVPEGDPDDYCDIDEHEDTFFEDPESGIIFQCQEKGEIMQLAANDLVETLNDVNVGLMRFYDPDLSGGEDRDGGSVILSMDTIDDSTAGETQRTDFQTEINGLAFDGHTPLMETLYEAHLYYANKLTLNAQSNIDPSAVTGTGSNERYVSPIEHSCQSNNIVYLSDGIPFSDGDDTVEDAIDLLLPTITPAIVDQACNFDDSQGDADGDNCMDELAEYMARADHSGTIDGTNSVNVYTIGFDIDLPLLSDTARRGNGEYFIASDYLELQRAFQSILVDIALSAPTALVAPAVSVNSFNELQHRDELYYAVFEPASSPKWQGNVKKYRIANGDVLDANDDVAIDPVTGFFREGARSFWSDEVDSANVAVGGMREQFTAARRVFVDGSSLETPTAAIVQLDSTSQLSLAATDAVDAVEAATIRDWILGEDVGDTNADGSSVDPHRYAAESLHAQPFVVTYRGTSTEDAEDVLFVPTNQGFLHAINARNESGDELWAYIPEELLGNSKAYWDNNENDSHVYGLDGETTVFTEEAPNSSSTNFELETVQIFQGMRRGGRNYFAWDVSNALSTSGTPISTMWTINGGFGDFSQLGQTWSKMIRTQISYGCDAAGGGCTTQDVLVFSGGYDTHYDDVGATAFSASSSVKGNALYIVDAETGALLWSAGDGNSGHDLVLDMYNSIPASPTPVDLDSDGDMDMLFAIDISGKIWRIDFNEEAASPTASNGNADGFTQGGMIADLSTNAPRRFYNALDASLSAPRGERPYFNLVVGSGYRAHPADAGEGTNGIFVVYDENVFEPRDDNNDGVYEYGYLESGATVSFSNGDLFQATPGDLAVRGENAIFGFYISLEGADEKILQQTTTFNGRVLLASYIPQAGSEQEDVCGSGNTGGGRSYVFDLETGGIVFSTELQHDGIPPEPSILFQEEGGLTVCFGTECDPPTFDPNDPIDDGGPGECMGPFTSVSQSLCLDVGRADRTYWREDQ